MDKINVAFIFLAVFFLHSLLILIEVQLFPSKITLLYIKSVRRKELYFSAFLIFLFCGYLIYLFGLPNQFLFLGSGDLLYEQRDLFSESISGINGYIIRWIPDIFIMFIYSFSVEKKDKTRIAAFLATFFLLLLSQYRGQKSYMVKSLILFFLLFKHVTVEKFKGILIKGLNIVLFLSTVICFGVFNGTNSLFFTLFFITRRAIITTSMTTVYWIDWFSNNPKEYLSYIFNKPLINTADLIGSIYRDNSHTNSGFIADGYANFGILGVFFYLLFIDLLCMFLDKQFSFNKDNNIGTILFLIFPVISFLGTRLTIVLLSGGFFIIIFLSLFSVKRGLEHDKSQY